MQKMISKKCFFRLMNNAVFGETMENRSKKELFNSRPNYYTTESFSENLLAIEMKKWQIIKNKPVYSCLSILEMSKTVMYDYVKPKYREETKLC